MPDVWDFPFRLAANGQVEVIEQDTDRDVENLIAVAVYTRPGERIQAPTFGVADPAFVGWEQAALQRHLLDFGPDVQVTTVDVQRTPDHREQVSVTWEHREQQP